MKRKRYLSALLALCVLLTLFPVRAAEMASGTCGDNLHWTLVDGVLTVSGTGKMQNWSTTGAPWYQYRESIVSAVISEGVTSIGNHAFFRYNSLKSLTIPDSVTSLGIWFLTDCSLTSLYIPRNVTNIGNSAFYCLKNLNDFSVDSANPAYASVDGVVFTKDMRTLVAYPAGRQGTYQIPNGVTNIAESAFGGCGGLSGVSIPDSVTVIGDYAFDWCVGLTDIRIPDSVTSIGSYAFTATQLTDVSIPRNVTRLGAGAFRYCETLTDIHLPSGVSSIAKSAFQSCTALKDVWYAGTEEQWKQIQYVDSEPLAAATVHFNASPGGTCGDNLRWTLIDGVLTISGTGEMYNYWSDNLPPWNNYSNQIERVEILEGVTSIGSTAFHSCPKVTEISIPDSVNALGYNPMGACGSLTTIKVSGGNAHFTSVDGVLYNKDKTRLCYYPGGLTASFEIPAGVTEIGSQAFCSAKVTEVTIPEGVTVIGLQAFGYSQLTTARIPLSVKEIVWLAFDCGKLSDVWYAGTEEQWNAVKIDKNGNDPLFSATIHFNEQKKIPGLAELTYSFANSASGLGYPTPYRIPYERYVTIFGETIAAKWHFMASGDWGGDCYGFTSTAAMFSQDGNGVDTGAFRDGAMLPAQLQTGDKNASLGITAREFLECMQVSQNSPLIQKDYLNNKNKLNELCDAVKAYQETGKSPVMVAVFGRQGGHALLAYKLEQDKLYVYDCNYPATERYITLITDAFGNYTGWHYPINSSIEWGSAFKESWISFIPYADFYSVWDNRAQKSATKTELLTVNADVVLKNEKGVPIASVENGELVTTQPDIFPLIEIGITADGQSPKKDNVSFWIPVGIYDLERKGDSVRAQGEVVLMDAENPFKANVTHVEQSADVQTTSDKFKFVVDDESELNKVMFPTDAVEGTYDVTFQSTLTGEQRDARIVGNVSTNALTFGMVGGQAVADATSMLSITAYFVNGKQVGTDNASGYAIDGVTIDGGGVTVKLANAVSASVSVVVCTYDDGGKLLASAVRAIDSGASAELALQTSGAAYLKAFLLDPATCAPLCSPFYRKL